MAYQARGARWLRTKLPRLLGKVVDPGAEDRNRALRNEEAAARMWEGAMGTEPSAGELFNYERYYSGDGPRQSLMLRPEAVDDEQSKAAQIQALQQMQGIASAGGYTDLERGQIAQAQRQAAQQEKSQRDAILQQSQMRGMGGGGAQMAAQLQAQQSGANRAADQSTDIATAAQMRALQAMQNSGQLAGQQRNQEAANQGQLYEQKSTRADAIDAFNQANTQRRQNVTQRNAAGRTAATQGAWENTRDLMAGRTGQLNTAGQNATTTANQKNEQAAGLLNTVGGWISS